MFGIEFGTVVFLTCAACGHGLGATQRRTRRDTTTRTGGGSMCEDLSLRERPRRHEIDHEMAIRREREATSPRDRSRDGDLAREATSPRDGAWYIPHSRRTRSRVDVRLFYQRFESKVNVDRVLHGAGSGANGPHAAPSAHANSELASPAQPHRPTSEQGRTRVVLTILKPADFYLFVINARAAFPASPKTFNV